MKKLTALLLILALSLSFVIGCTDDGSNEGDTSSDVTETDSSSESSSETAETEEDNENVAGSDVYEPLKYGDKKLTIGRITVHDPSIVYEPVSGNYYIFGSHRGWAKSTNLARWSTVSTTVDNNYKELFKSNIEWSSHGSANYDVSGNLWAPDVIYNEAMGKWCMYMSINGDNYYSSIALLTADKITGRYEYAGTLVYSGFVNSKQVKETDYADVTGSTNISRYVSGGAWNSSYGPNAIDPCVFYDENGDLWMSYGSWFGGIFLMKLDNETGLRDTSYTYEYELNASDPYFGYRLSGGYGCTGEGSYIVWDKDTGYYYMYVSYCGLNATDNFSGYHIRLFRSENVNGPYVDAAGNSAICTKSGENQSNKGIKLFGNYYFESLKGNGDNSRSGYMSPGHNSAFIDTDGQRYLVYHTRFNLGNEWHAVRVHQQFMNEDGWPVTAVYEHQGSVISADGYSSDDIVGEYEYVDHGLASATTYTDMLKTKTVTLNADGTMTGDVEGTWEQVEGTDGNKYYATFVIKSVTYKGVFFKQYDESKNNTERMTFSLIGENNHSIWGSKTTTD